MYSFYPPAFILVDFIMYNVFSFLLLGTALNEHIIYVDIQRFKNKILLLLLLLFTLGYWAEGPLGSGFYRLRYQSEPSVPFWHQFFVFCCL